ncbi:MAG: M48 family metalloprotease [Proteobacteria bacterium]|nr:M48 family metalloprotease [Pseudomonadota bacterium]
MRSLRLLCMGLPLIGLGGCITNPITGETELGWVSTEQQIAIGTQQYVPSQQMQGGQFVADAELVAYVTQVGNRVSAKSPARLPYEFVILNNPVPNAWALPGGKIAVNRGLLLEMKNEAELAAVLGHEVIHAAGRHGAEAMERGMLLQGAMLAAAVGAQTTEYGGMVMQGAMVGAQLITQRYGRDAEREADFYGTRMLAEAGYDPQAAVTLQETFLRLSGEKQTDFIQGLFASHPPSAERVANNKGLVRTLRSEGYTNGEFGADRYQAALRGLRQAEPAYKAFDEAQAALSADKPDEALSKVNEALRLYPSEPSFHGLRGDIRQTQKRYKDALTNYDRAIGIQDNLFSLYLSRGLAHVALANSDAAKADLTASAKLLPTAVALNELGKIAEAQGDQATAIKYYEAAAASRSESGQAALVSLLRLDLANSPQKYIQAELARDAQGVIMRVSNRTSSDLYDVEIQVDLDWASGIERVTPRLQQIPARSSKIIRISTRSEQLRAFRAQPLGARVK